MDTRFDDVQLVALMAALIFAGADGLPGAFQRTPQNAAETALEIYTSVTALAKIKPGKPVKAGA